MKRTTLLAVLLAIPSTVWAADNEVGRGPAPEIAPPAPPEAPVEIVSVPEAAPALAVGVASGAVALAAMEPEPVKGWRRGRRAPMYVNLMLSVGALGEDGSNRLTTRDSKILEGFGGTLRLGAVLDEHHRLGARLQSFVRPTKKILQDSSSTPATTSNEWGAVSFGYVGPEYLYTTDLGLYAGASVGFGFAMSSRDINNKNDDDKTNHIERGSAGAAGFLSLGYEWRASKWFAVNAEIYGGLYRGVDDNDNGMNGSLFGFAMGAGF
jgi:hypothetical protein